MDRGSLDSKIIASQSGNSPGIPKSDNQLKFKNDFLVTGARPDPDRINSVPVLQGGSKAKLRIGDSRSVTGSTPVDNCMYQFPNEANGPSAIPKNKCAQLEEIIEELKLESSNWFDSNNLINRGELGQNSVGFETPKQMTKIIDTANITVNTPRGVDTPMGVKTPTPYDSAIKFSKSKKISSHGT